MSGISTKGLAQLVRDLRTVSNGLSTATQMQKLAQLSISMIQARTQLGIDKDGRKFKAYTPKYKRFKAASGRGTSPVNLTFKGDMMRSLGATDVKRGSVRITFNNANEGNKASGNIEKYGRDFMGLRKSEENNLVRELEDDYMRMIKSRFGF